MFTRTGLEAFKKAAEVCDSVAIYLEMPGDNVTPVSTFLRLGDEAKGASLLESSEKELSQSQYSFIGLHPLASTKDSGIKTFAELKAFHRAQYCASTHPLSGFLGGIVGFLAYDVVKHFEKLPDRHPNTEDVPDFLFRAYKSNITFDHHNNKVVLMQIVKVNQNPEAAYQAGMLALEALQEKIQSPASGESYKKIDEIKESDAIESDVSDADFIDMVERAKQYIVEGDIFQVVLSRSFRRKIQAHPFEVYRALRMVSPAPYLFYLDAGDYVVTGASPEKLVTVKNGEVSTCPLAGTRPRGANPTEDKINAEHLLKDEKELAEHVMLVDLARNDLGATCKPGSIAVTAFKQVKNFSHVMHISSEVTGILADDKDAFDAMKYAFPAGTLSGAPKIRAMEIIDELEHSRRGVYGGAICFIDAKGHLNSCITIRTTFIKDNVATVRAGAGIVFDSDPQKEADETRYKARSVLKSIDLAEGGFA